jgi:hypothetical protein
VIGADDGLWGNLDTCLLADNDDGREEEQINSQDHILCSHQSTALKCIGTKQENVNARK